MEKAGWIFQIFVFPFLLCATASHAQGPRDEVRVLHFQETGVPSNDTYAVLGSSLPAMREFTLCYRIHVYFYRKEVVVTSYAISDDTLNVIRLDHTSQGFRMIIYNALDVAADILPLRQWSHYCLVVSLSTGNWFMTVQGRVAARRDGDPRLKGRTIPGGGLFVLGQEQDILGGGFQTEQSLCGALAEFQLWNYTVDETTISRIARMQSGLQGNVINWSETKWDLYGNITSEEVEKKVLQRSHVDYVMLATKRPFKEAKRLCQILQGKIAAPVSDKENEKLFDHSATYYSLCENNIGYIYLWVGYTDAKVEGEWLDSSTDHPMPYNGSWSIYEPNGANEENCAALYYVTRMWNDVTCSRGLMCTVCQFDHRVWVKILGLCERSGLDSDYLLAGEVNGRPFFAGNKTSRIIWSSDISAWMIESLWDNATIGIMQASDDIESILPMGSRIWKFSNSLCPGAPRVLELTVTACGAGYYTCGEGSCVPLHLRCDRRTDCPDRSDEEHCSILGLSKGYRNEIPPSNHENLTLALPVYVWVEILALPSINTIHMEFNVDFTLKLAWHDHRLFYYNLKEEVDLNNLAQEERSKIWTPSVSFKSARGNSHTILDEEARIHVLKAGEPLSSTSSYAHEVDLFSGTDAPLLLERKYHVRYGCAFTLNRYPFDTQNCVMEFESLFTTISSVVLRPGHVHFLGRRQLIEYVVGDVSMETMHQNSSFSGLQVRLIFIRQSGYHLVATYLPTSIMIVIAYLTFFFRVEDFTDRIMVSLTSLLVLSSLLTQTSEALPKTSYFKMVDVWLFFCIVTIFSVIIIHTASIYVDKVNDETITTTIKSETIKINVFSSSCKEGNNFSGFSREEDLKEKLRKISTSSITPAGILTFGKIIVPVAVAIFNITYWIIALIR